MINKLTHFENPDEHSCADTILSNCTRNFHNSFVVETGLLDFQKIKSVLKYFGNLQFLRATLVCYKQKETPYLA